MIKHPRSSLLSSIPFSFTSLLLLPSALSVPTYLWSFSYYPQNVWISIAHPSYVSSCVSLVFWGANGKGARGLFGVLSVGKTRRQSGNRCGVGEPLTAMQPWQLWMEKEEEELVPRTREQPAWRQSPSEWWEIAETKFPIEELPCDQDGQL